MSKKAKEPEAPAAETPAETVTAVETCPACTSAVDAKADSCPQCGADLAYFREQAAAAKDSASE